MIAHTVARTVQISLGGGFALTLFAMFGTIVGLLIMIYFKDN